jgi:hypothetical protein
LNSPSPLRPGQHLHVFDGIQITIQKYDDDYDVDYDGYVVQSIHENDQKPMNENVLQSLTGKTRLATATPRSLPEMLAPS